MVRMARRFLLFLVLVSFIACEGCPFIGGDDDEPISRVTLAFPVPALISVLQQQDDLSASLQIYDTTLTSVFDEELSIKNGLVQFEEFQGSPLGSASTKTATASNTGSPVNAFSIPDQIILTQGKSYTFVIVFQIHTGGGVLLPVAYIKKTLTFDQTGTLLSFVDDDLTYSNPGEVLNDLSPGFSINGIAVPNLDQDGDNSPNIAEFADDTDPADPAIFPTPSLTRCGNNILNKKEECDDGNTDDTDTCTALCKKAAPIVSVLSPIENQTVRDVVIILAEAASPFGVRSLIPSNPTGIEDTDFSSETFQGIWDTTNLTDDESLNVSFSARDEEGRERVKSVKVTVDNFPNILSFGSDTTITAGETVDLSWSVTNASSLSIDKLDGGERKLFTLSGKTSVAPATTTTYTLSTKRISSQGKIFIATTPVTIKVNAQPSAPALTKLPALTSTSDTLFAWSTSNVASACHPLSYSLTVKEPNKGGLKGATVFTQTGLSATSFDTASLDSNTQLNPRSDYEVQLSAMDDCGQSASSGFTAFSTLAQGMVGWWRFEDSGNIGLNSRTAAKHKGIASDSHPGDGSDLPEQSDGVTTSQKGLLFKDFDPYLDFGEDSILKNINNTMTAEAWFAPSAYQSVYLFTHGDETTGWAIMQAGDDLKVMTSNAGDNAVAMVENIFSPNIWTHIAFSYDGHRVRVYVNGYLRATAELQGNLVFGASDKTILGSAESALGSTPPNNLFFKGSADEVAIYDTALSSAEIRANCRLNDPDNLCAKLGVPEQIFVSHLAQLAPGRAFVSWQAIDQPSAKTLTNYTLCFVANGDISGTNDCLNSKTTTDTHFVIENMETNSQYSWKVIANFSDGTKSDPSAVWQFTSDDSVIDNFDFASEGGVRELDGTSSQTVNNVLNSGDNNFLTIETRTKVRDINASFNPAIIIAGGGSNGFRMQTTSISGKIQCQMISNDVGDEQTLESFGYITDEFNHVVCGYSRTEGLKQIFVNTELGDEIEATGVMSFDDAEISIGADPNASIDMFDGFIDDITFYDKTLTELEIRNNYCALEAKAGTDPLPGECF